MFQYNGTTISIDRPFTAPDGTKYANLRNPAIREALSVTEVADPPAYDQRFFWSPDNPKLLNDREEVDENGDPMWVKVLDNSDPENPVMVDSDERLVSKGLKSQWTAQFKQTAYSMLSPTDYKLVRQVETGEACGQAVLDYRTAVRAEYQRLENAVTACTTVEELIAVIGSQNWPT